MWHNFSFNKYNVTIYGPTKLYCIQINIARFFLSGLLIFFFNLHWFIWNNLLWRYYYKLLIVFCNNIPCLSFSYYVRLLKLLLAVKVTEMLNIFWHRPLWRRRKRPGTHRSDLAVRTHSLLCCIRTFFQREATFFSSTYQVVLVREGGLTLNILF